MDSDEEKANASEENDTKIYDPNQDPEEKRKIRNGYRHQLKKIEDHSKDFKNLDVNVLFESVQVADNSFGGVRAPQEAILDSRLLTAMSNLSAAKARDLKHDGGGFDTDDFIASLVTYLGGGRVDLEEDGEEVGDAELDWEKLGYDALAISRRAIGLDFMLGPLYSEAKQRAKPKRARMEKEKEAPVVKPHEVDLEAEQQQEEQTAQSLVRSLGELMSQLEGPTNVFKIFVNPESFAQSVENLFYLSFLIRDGRVALDISEGDGEMLVGWCEQPTSQDYQDGLMKRQSVWEFDEETWRLAIEAYDIKEPFFPTRAIPPPDTYRFLNA
ncbi:nuclear protein [Tulasnella sp. 403]|nr:nuclear protein [Tulasnella sp. 403]